jgi:hypothetical protein
MLHRREERHVQHPCSVLVQFGDSLSPVTDKDKA